MTDKPLEFEPPASTDELLAAISRLDDDLHGIRNGDIRPIKTNTDEIQTDIMSLAERLDKLVESHNQVGQNVAWLVANTQGLFQMFSDPNVINQMMSGMMGGLANGGQPGAPASTDAK